MFSLKLMNHVSHAYIFEYQDRWVKALGETFSPYREKTDVIKKYVSDCTTEKSIRLDDIFKQYAAKDDWGNKEQVTLIVKMDIEGAEMKALDGMRKMLKEYPKVQLFVCAYHNQEDEDQIRSFFQDGYEIRHTTGYFCFYEDPSYGKPYIRRCVMKIRKKNV